jgi:hypothetical protein
MCVALVIQHAKPCPGLFCHLWHVCLHNIFNIIIKRVRFSFKKGIEHKVSDMYFTDQHFTDTCSTVPYSTDMYFADMYFTDMYVTDMHIKQNREQ